MREGVMAEALTDRPGARVAAGDAALRPWGAWTSLLWVVAAEGIRTFVDLGLDRVPLQTFGQYSYAACVLVITLSWAVPIIVLLVAVRIARGSFAAYCNWRRPGVPAIALAVVTFLVAELVLRGVPYLATGSLKSNLPIEDYQK